MSPPIQSSTIRRLPLPLSSNLLMSTVSRGNGNPPKGSGQWSRVQESGLSELVQVL